MGYYTSEDLREYSIAQVLQAKNPFRSAIIAQYAEHLENVDFIFADDALGEDLITPVLNMFGISDKNMCSVFCSNKLRIMNAETVRGTKRGFTISYDIGMETQIVSYIARYLEGKLDENLVPVISPLQIKRHLPTEINIDAYVLENCGIDEAFNSIKIKNIWSAFYFYNLPIMDKTSAAIKADDAVKQIEAFIKQAKMTGRYIERYYFCYCFLLKIVFLNFSNLSIREKLMELIKFENDTICTSDAMFLNIAEAFWNYGTKIRFFGKVQKGKKDILTILKNMSWDLFHWSHTSLNFNFSYNYQSDISIPLIYSIDARFLELTKYARIEGVAIDNKSKVSYPYFNTSVLNKLSHEEQLMYLGSDALHRRNENRKNVNTIKICKELEKALLNTRLFPI